MKKFYTSIVITFLIITVSSAEQITYHGGEKEQIQLKRFDGEILIHKDGQIPRNDIRKIAFSAHEDTEIDEADFDGARYFWPYDSLQKIAGIYQESYKDASGIIIVDHGKDMLRSDGTQFYRYHFAGKILKSEALSWGTKTLWFDEGRSKVAVTGARVIYPDGKIKLWNPKNYTISSGAGEMVHFDNDVYYTATFPEVTEGCIVEYVYERDEYNPYDKNMFFPGWYFGDEMPVYSSKIDVFLPKDKSLYYRTTSFPDDESQKPEITENDTSKIYTWHLMDIAPMADEPNMPDYGDVVAHMEGSIFEDYEYIYNWLGEMQKNRMEITPQIEAKVEEITKDYETLEEKAAAIYYFIQREIEYISIKASVSSGQTGHSAHFTLENKYGDCTDKSILLCTMYKALGMESRPVIVMTNDDETVDRSLPNYSGNHAITLLKWEGEDVFLDGTYTSMQFPYCGEWDMGTSYLDAAGRKTGYTSIIDPKDNSRVSIYKIELERDGAASFFRKDKLKGPYESSYRDWWEYYPQTRWNELSSNYINTYVPGAIVDSFYVNGVGQLFKPLVEKYYFYDDDYAILAKDLMLFKMPGLEKSYSFEEIALANRRYPLQYEAPYSLAHNVEISLPEKNSIDFLPDEIEIENQYVYYKGKYELIDGKIHFTDEFILKERIIPVDDYELYKDALLEIANYARKQVVLKIEV
ncbi:MAG: DUF3857 domain-containing transglutaminase family protein [Candidatus Zixiibacteriota bacterium]